MTSPALDLEPACPGAPSGHTSSPSTGRSEAPLQVEQRPIDAIPPDAWDQLAAATPWATPFSSYAFHRAWWDAYGANAHEQTLIVCRADASQPLAIVPLMHRHQVEPTDPLTQSTMRHGGPTTLTPVSPTAKAIFFGRPITPTTRRSLPRAESLPAVTESLATHLAAPPSPIDPHPVAVGRRRPAPAALRGPGRRRARGRVRAARDLRGLDAQRRARGRLPVIHLPEGASFDDYLATLGKKERHEIRRKIRRAEASGDVALTDSMTPLDDLDEFIDLHQRKWGDLGLFPPTPGGEASRTFVRRLFEEQGSDGTLRLSFLTVGDRRIAAGLMFRTPEGYLYYNAGVDPDARDLSPGVLLVAEFIRRALADGARRFDFLRGDEPYKYEWGAVDEPIQRILVRRDAARRCA
jgi:hypothetical protein